MDRHAFTRCAVALLAGTVFGLGLSVAQMTDPLKVLGFLDVAGDWDPSLLFVMGGALALATLAFRFVLRRPAPVLDDRFHLSTALRVDAKLVGGSVLFGIGWGLAGYCPGPALASLGFANAEALWFVPAMLAGTALQRWVSRRRAPPGKTGQ
jgi:uncharacterized membrane protein YedE/YeeE